MSDLRKLVGYGTEPGTGYVIDEDEDGARISVNTPMALAVVELDATALMNLTRDLADWFGHVVVNPTVERDKLREIVGSVLALNESRCLDDETDRGVVARELIAALTGWTKSLPKSLPRRR